MYRDVPKRTRLGHRYDLEACAMRWLCSIADVLRRFGSKAEEPGQQSQSRMRIEVYYISLATSKGGGYEQMK